MRPKADPADRPADRQACERLALNLLARREHSRLELERKLAARAFPADVVTETLDRLEQNGSLDGQRFMESFVASRAERGVGPDRIRAELVQRGMPGADADSALREAGLDWRALARRAREKRFGREPPATFEERARQARFLRGRGFSADQIRTTLEVSADSD